MTAVMLIMIINGLNFSFPCLWAVCYSLIDEFLLLLSY